MIRRLSPSGIFYFIHKKDLRRKLTTNHVSKEATAFEESEPHPKSVHYVHIIAPHSPSIHFNMTIISLDIMHILIFIYNDVLAAPDCWTQSIEIVPVSLTEETFYLRTKT
jgi:hypothetical protein